METENQYHNRRILEIKERITVLDNYIKGNSEIKHIEPGTGKSYISRRNSRIKANKEYRVSQFISEKKGLERVLKMHLEKNKELATAGRSLNT